MTLSSYDAIVIGAGQGGTPLATALARSGRRTALIERKHVGGTCINTGCTPTKTMIASAQVAHIARRAADYGVSVGGRVTVDLEVVRRRTRDTVRSMRAGILRRLESTPGLDLLRGEARFVAPKTLEVTLHDGATLRLRADTLFIDTGSRPARPPIDGLEGVPIYHETEMEALGCVPDHLVVLGGGYIGVEFGQMFRRFGSQVTIVQRGEQLLSHEDRDVADELAVALRDEGITLLLRSEVFQVAPEAGGVRLTLRGADGPATVSGSHLLVATGRVPNTDALDLDAAGIETDERGHITVNGRLETNVPGVYALGDVIGGPAFTHVSYDHFRVLCANVIQGGHASTTDRLVPYTVFSDPQLGRVGPTEREARAQGRKIRVAKLPMSHVARAIETGRTHGLLKALVDADSQEILGCAMLGPEGGELMAQIEVAMMGRLPYTTLRDGVFAHPTLAEALNTLFSSFEE